LVVGAGTAGDRADRCGRSILRIDSAFADSASAAALATMGFKGTARRSGQWIEAPRIAAAQAAFERPRPARPA